MNDRLSTAVLLFLAGGVVAAAYFRSRVRKYVNATREVNTVNPSRTTVVDGQGAGKAAVSTWRGPVDFTVGSDVVLPYGGSTRMQTIVRDSAFTSPQYVKPSLKAN